MSSSESSEPGKSKTIKVDYLARVEGEGSLYLKIRDGAVEDAKLKIFEPPRFFEAFLRGRDFREAPDITARICGICPVAYLMSACHAMESVCGVRVDGQLRALRRLLYCGEWIESHGLHVFMLHAPDFYGFDDAVAMAKAHPELVQRGLRLKKLGNAIMTALGGREVHPINIKLGGFYRAPRRRELDALRGELEWAREFTAVALARLKELEFPDFERDYEFMGLRHPSEYPLNEGRLVSSAGVDEPISRYDCVLREVHVAHSTSLQSRRVGGGPVHMGPMARYALNHDKLPPEVQQLARDAGLGARCQNPFQSVLVRMVEIAYAVHEAARIIAEYAEPDAPAIAVEPRAGTGYGATEAPRGVCYQRYTIDDAGVITDCKIVAPTSVNQAVIEEDLRVFAGARAELPDEQLRWQCEQAIRNYDPCISCSCHFLKLDVERV
ncbi:MAG: nickel-dependent hydrogenase large subunit [Myxococcales bacterium]|nr:nickel-dependent hydrogenase large subunit [Myxococcales bacterium]